MLHKLSFKVIEKLPGYTQFDQLDNGTLFYYSDDRPAGTKLYYKRNGTEVIIPVPDEFERSRNGYCPYDILPIVACGDIFYTLVYRRFSNEQVIYKLVMTPTKDFVMTRLRSVDVEAKECILSRGVCQKIQEDGSKIFHHVHDKYAIKEVLSKKELEGMKMLCIHNNRIVYRKLISNVVKSTFNFGKNWITIEEGELNQTSGYNAHPDQDSPFIFIPLTGRRVIKPFDTSSMKFLPDLHFEGISSISSFIRMKNGAVTVLGTLGTDYNDYCLAVAQLPAGYYNPTVPIEYRKEGFVSEFLAKFVPLKVLGEGGFGCVFEAKNKIDDCTYAVKRIALLESEQPVDKALEEVRTLAKLRHDGIVGYNSSWIEKPPARWQKRSDAAFMQKIGYNKPLNYSEDCTFLYIQMELCTKSLADWIYSTKNRDITQAKKWFKQMVSAVSYLHSMNKLHRDLKPWNVLFAKNGRVKICDLGLIAERKLRNGQENDITRTIKGTRMYMAPEQLQGKYSSKVDVYSLGLILAELCVCMTLNDAFSVFMLYQAGRPTKILKHLPQVDEFVSWLTNYDPNKRPNCEAILKHTFLAQ